MRDIKDKVKATREALILKNLEINSGVKVYKVKISWKLIENRWEKFNCKCIEWFVDILI